MITLRIARPIMVAPVGCIHRWTRLMRHGEDLRLWLGSLWYTVGSSRCGRCRPAPCSCLSQPTSIDIHHHVVSTTSAGGRSRAGQARATSRSRRYRVRIARSDSKNRAGTPITRFILNPTALTPTREFQAQCERLQCALCTMSRSLATELTIFLEPPVS